MADWVIIVDDDTSNLKIAGRILSKIGIRVTALKSGQALLDYLQRNAPEAPDLILMDIMMPEMNGFETLRRLRELREGEPEIPIIFLSSDQKREYETEVLQQGALDYIGKPFVPDVLISRVQNALRTQEKLQQLEQEAMIDHMTGFLNKSTVEDRMDGICRSEEGFLCVLDLDSFKLINDLYGHDMGDRVLIMFSNLLKNNMRSEDVCGRIGGDEFILFTKNMRTETELQRFTERINRDFLGMMRRLLGEPMNVPLGVSIGAAAVPTHGHDYKTLFHLADQALNVVKLNGKHGCALSGSPQANHVSNGGELSLESVTMILEERNISKNAMWMGREAFINIYRYMMRYMERYHGVAYRVLFSISPKPDPSEAQARANIIEQFRQMIQESLRNSDVMVEISETQIFLLLPETHDAGIDVVIERLMRNWNQSEYHDQAAVTWETGPVHLSQHDAPSPDGPRKDWVVVVDDDSTTRKSAEQLLAKQEMRVTALDSGFALIDFLKNNHPDLIILDVKMPEMDGFETLKQLKENPWSRDIPVIFITADESWESETLGLQLGAEDFIKKPFVPEILTQRVKRTIELNRYQRNLANEVSIKTEQKQKLFVDVVSALATAIDAKDTYTNGHSGRVALYAREIARRHGYNEKKQSDIHIMGLLHDVGKIGVPDTIINKPGKLTPAEYETIKTHSVMGARILQTINDMPALAVGARWHHERYDGHGYPDGLAGEDIPEEARIIAVADAYDAMSSRRSYRDDMPQSAIRAEIERCSGTQFDPVFARIMLDMIDEDIDYQMKE